MQAGPEKIQLIIFWLIHKNLPGSLLILKAMAVSAVMTIFMAVQADDMIFGQEGNDIIVGGEGADVLHGGSGADTFVFDNVGHGVDTVSDFNAGEGDVINLSSVLSGL